MEYKFKTGIKSIDEELLKGGFYKESLITIGGHPGAGKTTFAAMIAYHNGLEGKRTLYVSFQENKKKFYKHMKNFGMDLEALEREGRFMFVKLPLVATQEGAEEVVAKISGMIYELNADIIIVDSINPLIEAYTPDVSRRAVVQNFFYTLPELTGGLGVLIAEIPFGQREQPILGSVDFVADAVFILYHYIEQGQIVREMEIRKLRGYPLNYARLPFFIRSGKGIVVWTPPRLELVPGIDSAKYLEPPCSVMEDYFGKLYKGEIVLLSFPSDARPVRPITYTFAVTLLNNARTLILSYDMSPDEIKKILEIQLAEAFNFEDKIVKKLIEIFEKQVEVVGINPAAYSAQELYSLFMDIITEKKPDVLLVLGVHKLLRKMIFKEAGDIKLFDNIILSLKAQGIFTMLAAATSDPYEYNVLSELADGILRYNYIMSEGEIKKYIYVWMKGKDPALFDTDISRSCCKDIIERLNNSLNL
ncbi:MAG: hypothetical protein GSR77_05940 [Desulfurococcales archaeon]|nr:hypothetical protein [Desulfurococcales archaeon]